MSEERAAVSPNLRANLYKAEDALARFSLQIMGYCRHSLSEPYRHALAPLVAKLENPGSLSGPEKLKRDQAIARWRGLWEGWKQELSRLIEEEERALTAYEDRVDYFHVPGNLNPVLKDREESVKMQREILSREVFQLRASRQKYPSLLSRGLNWRQVRTISARLKEKERALAAITLEFDAVRREWEKERRVMLRDDPSLLRHWSGMLVSIGHLKLEKGFIESHLDSLIMESAAHQFVMEGLGAHLCDTGGDVLQSFREKRKGIQTLLKETGILEKRLHEIERKVGPVMVSLPQTGDTGMSSHDESQAEKILGEFCRCIDGFTDGESDMLLKGIPQCHDLLDRFDAFIDAAERLTPGQNDAQAWKELP